MADTAQQLKGDIDSGRTGDKIEQGFDPGLSTLGTDDEASGAPVTPAQAAEARRLETRGVRPPADQASLPSRSRHPVTLAIAAVFVLLVIALLVGLR